MTFGYIHLYIDLGLWFTHYITTIQHTTHTIFLIIKLKDTVEQLSADKINIGENPTV